PFCAQRRVGRWHAARATCVSTAKPPGRGCDGSTSASASVITASESWVRSWCRATSCSAHPARRSRYAVPSSRSAAGVRSRLLAVADDGGLTTLPALLRAARRAARLALGDDRAARRRTLPSLGGLRAAGHVREAERRVAAWYLV